MHRATRSTIRLVCATIACGAVVVGCASHKSQRQQAVPLKGDATFAKYPLAGGAPQEGEDFVRMREQYYILPRAYPMRVIDERSRLRAYQGLQRMRRALNLKHVNVGWADRPGAPNARGPGGCAWYSAGPTNVNGRVTGIAIDRKY